MGSNWYYVREKRVLGPYTSSEFRRMARQEEIDEDTPVSKRRHGPWVPARRVKGLFGAPDKPGQAAAQSKPDGTMQRVDAPEGDVRSAEPKSLEETDAGGSDERERPSSRKWIVPAAITIPALFLVVALCWWMLSKEEAPPGTAIAKGPVPVSAQPSPISSSSGDNSAGTGDRRADQASDNAITTPQAVEDDPISLEELKRDLALDEPTTPVNATPSPAAGSAPEPPPPADSALRAPPADEPMDRAGPNDADGPSAVATPDEPPAAPSGDVSETSPRPAASSMPDASASAPADTAAGDKPADAATDPPSEAPAAAPGDQRLVALWEMHEENRDLFGELAVHSRELERRKLAMAESGQKGAAIMERLRWLMNCQENLVKDKQSITKGSPNIATPNHDRQILTNMQELSRLKGELGAVESDVVENRKHVDGLDQKFRHEVLAADRIMEESLELCDPFGWLDRDIHERAVEEITGRILDDGRFPPFYLVRGFAYVHVDKYPLALKDFDRAAELHPRIEVLRRVARGYALSCQGEERRAKGEFDAAEKLSPRLPMICVFRAFGFLEQQEYNKAERQFLQAIRYDEESVDALHGLAHLWATRPQSRVATQKKTIEYAEKACDLTRMGEWSCLDTLAMARAAAGEFQEALQSAKQAERLAPPENRAAVQQRIHLYQSGKPYRPLEE